MQNLNINYIIGVFVVAALGWLGYVVFQGDEVKQSENKIQEVQSVTENYGTTTNPTGTTSSGNEIKKEEVKKETKFMKQESYKVTMNTNYGTIVLELDGKTTPITAGSFAENAAKGYYNGVKFHRVIKGFMLQGGDPLTKDDSKQNMWGTGGEGSKGGKFNDENFILSNAPGTISMANAGPNTNGSQFFINTGNNTFLNGKHTVFGKVISGMDVVVKIENVKTMFPGQLDRPEKPVVINTVVVE
jgi:peptidylprolyl isomerase